MNTGRDIIDIAKELKHQRETRKDFLADTTRLGVVVVEGENSLDAILDRPLAPSSAADAPHRVGELRLAGLPGAAPLAIRPLAHQQIAEDLKIPRAYYDRLLVDDPELLTLNINRPFERQPMKRLIRTLDGKVRAVLSDRYRPLDCYDLMDVALPTLQKRGAKIVSSELTEKRLYLKAIFPDLSEPIPGGMELGQGHSSIRKADGTNVAIAAVILSNSEVGAGSLRVEHGFFETWCTNLAISSDTSMRKHHVGRKHEFEGIDELLSDEAREADDKALWLKVRDVVTYAANPQTFASTVKRIHKAHGLQFADVTTAKTPDVVEVVSKEFGLSEQTGDGVLEWLIKGGDLSQWGLVRAVTRAAADVKDYDEATETERVGGKILSLSESSFGSLLRKAAA
jgi:hypothetical protein